MAAGSAITRITGCEGRISYLKRRYGFDRTLFDTLAGAPDPAATGPPRDPLFDRDTA